MDFQKILASQKELDQQIIDKYGIEKKSKKQEKTLAFLVELADLADETCCYKYWSKKVCADREIILNKYIKGLHFLLSTALDIGVRELDFPDVKHERPLVEQFLKVFSAVNDFVRGFNCAKFISLFAEYLVLGKSLGFTRKEIQAAYLDKNEVHCLRHRGIRDELNEGMVENESNE